MPIKLFIVTYSEVTLQKSLSIDTKWYGLPSFSSNEHQSKTSFALSLLLVTSSHMHTLTCVWLLLITSGLHLYLLVYVDPQLSLVIDFSFFPIFIGMP